MTFSDLIKVKLTTYFLQPLLNNTRPPLFFRPLKEFHKVSLSPDQKRCLLFFKNGYLEITASHPAIFRVLAGFIPAYATPYYPADYFSYAVLPKDLLPLKLSESETYLEIRLEDSGSPALLRFHKEKRILQFHAHGHLLFQEKLPLARLRTWIKQDLVIEKPGYFLGYGQKTGGLFKNGKKYRMWNTDNSDINRNSDPVYQSCPLVIFTQPAGTSFGLFFDNPHQSLFKMSRPERPGRLHYLVQRGPLALYLLAGPQLKDVVKQFSFLTGHAYLPPLWALGHHHSRWEPNESAQRLLNLAKEFRSRKIPCDVLHLDIGHMEGYRCFTWNKYRFPDPASFIRQLKEANFEAVVISDPGLKKDPSWPIYQEALTQDFFLKNPEGQIVHKPVWPGDAAFPDFSYPQAAQFWGKLYRTYTDLGLRGFWLDMNEPSTFTPRRTLPPQVLHREGPRGTPRDHFALHNYYGFLMAKATAEGLQAQLPKERFFLFTRSAYAGIQRYAASWTGDNRSNWEHLRLAIPMLLNMGLSGQVIVGPDIGGFWGAPTPELLVRFFQCATFFPFHRNHSASNTPNQEIWEFGSEIEAICRKAISLRYSFLPYLYTELWQAVTEGIPLMRPLFFEFPSDPQAYLTQYCETQYLAGPNLLVAPVLEPGCVKRLVYFPHLEDSEYTEQWVCYWTHRRYKGGQALPVAAPLDQLPLFIRNGSVIPTVGAISSTCELYEKPLIIQIYGHLRSKGLLYLDDGLTLAYQKQHYLLLEIEGTAQKNSLSLTIQPKAGNLKPLFYRFKEIWFYFARCPGDKIPLSVAINNKIFKQDQLELTDRWIIIKLQAKDF